MRQACVDAAAACILALRELPEDEQLTALAWVARCVIEPKLRGRLDMDRGEEAARRPSR